MGPSSSSAISRKTLNTNLCLRWNFSSQLKHRSRSCREAREVSLTMASSRQSEETLERVDLAIVEGQWESMRAAKLLGKNTSGFKDQHLQKAKEEEKGNFHWYKPYYIILIFIPRCNNKICNYVVTRPNRIWKWKNIVVDKWQIRVSAQHVSILPLYEIPKVCWCTALSLRPSYWLLLLAITHRLVFSPHIHYSPPMYFGHRYYNY